MLKNNFHRIIVLTATTLMWSCTPYSAIKATDESNNSANTTLGADGSCSVNQEAGGAMITCPDGSMAFVPNGTNGANGASGTNGVNGTNGTNGSSCSVQDLGTKALIICEDGTTAIIDDGADGKDGMDGKDGQNTVTASPLVNIINVCTAKGSEILLQFANGEVIGSYMIDQKYMVVIAPGMSQTKNETHCEFSVTSVKR